jgi:3-oxoacyl-[acyl-carrier protein] reductase
MARLMATNYTSVFVACKLAAPIMIAAGRGSIINTTAGTARDSGAWPGLSGYSATKAAVSALTRTLAAELSPLGVRVNSLNPGLIDTPMLRRFFSKQDDPIAAEKGAAQVPLLRRLGSPDELARAALFLASDDSSYMTGTDLLVDGGLALR